MALDGIHTAACENTIIFSFQSIMAQYSDEQQKKEFLDNLFTYLENEGMCASVSWVLAGKGVGRELFV